MEVQKGYVRVTKQVSKLRLHPEAYDRYLRDSWLSSWSLAVTTRPAVT